MSARLTSTRETALPASSFTGDIEGVLCNVNSMFNPLHKDFMLDFHVSGVRNGYVYLSIALPEGMTRVFVSLLESLHGFFRFMDIKAKHSRAQGKPVDAAEIARREKLHADFNEEVCSLFDGFIEQGHDTKEAVKRTNFTLKERNHPWATHDTILTVLRKSGKFRKSRRVNR